MQSLHGGFSVGLGIGGMVGALAAAAGAPAAVHLPAAALILAACTGVAGRWLLPDNPEPVACRPASPFRPSARLLQLTALAVGAAFVEVSLAEWGGVYLAQTLNATPAVAAGGFGALAVAMAIGRLGGDQLAGRLGLRLVAAGAAVAAAALLASRLQSG